MSTIIAICLAILTISILLIGAYFISVLSSCKKTIDEIGELIVYIKGEILGLKGPVSKSLDIINKVTSMIDEGLLGAKTIKDRIIMPFAFILGIYAGIKAILNVFLKGGDKDGE